MSTTDLPIHAASVVATAFGFVDTTVGLTSVALTFALLTPVLLLYGRHEVRLRRLRAIKDFVRSYGSFEEVRSAAGGAGGSGSGVVGSSMPSAAEKQAKGSSLRLGANPSFEFVKSKYISDVKIADPGPNEKPFDDLSEVDQINRIIESIGSFGSAADWRMLASTVGLMLLCYFGFSALGEALAGGLGSKGPACAAGIAANLCMPETYGNGGQLAIIGSLAFGGAYIAALRSLVRAVAVFDLTPYSFLRQTVEIIASVLFTIVLFAAFRNPAEYTADLIAKIVPDLSTAKDAVTATPSSGIPAVWYGLAPLLGLLPQSATKFLLLKFQTIVTWTKTSDDRFMEVTKVISPDIIDGIDYETRFRLEECGIYDVQNLATYNPIMLHIESPFGIYEVIDWIAQAQLCHIVGLEKFLILRELNIRTIFDLERAISDVQSIDAYDAICLGVLLAPTSALSKTLAIAGTALVVTDGTTSRIVGASEFLLWARSELQGSQQSKATEHLMRWIADDLHVRRLRLLWNSMSDRLGETSLYLKGNIDAEPGHAAASEVDETHARATAATPAPVDDVAVIQQLPEPGRDRDGV